MALWQVVFACAALISSMSLHGCDLIPEDAPGDDPRLLVNATTTTTTTPNTTEAEALPTLTTTSSAQGFLSASTSTTSALLASTTTASRANRLFVEVYRYKADNCSEEVDSSYPQVLNTCLGFLTTSSMKVLDGDKLMHLSWDNPSCSGEAAYWYTDIMSGCDRRSYLLLKLPPMDGPAYQVDHFSDKNCSSFTGQGVYLCGACYAVDGTYSVREHCLEDRILQTYFLDSLNCSGLATDPPNATGRLGFHNLTKGSCREGVTLTELGSSPPLTTTTTTTTTTTIKYYSSATGPNRSFVEVYRYKADNCSEEVDSSYPQVLNTCLGFLTTSSMKVLDGDQLMHLSWDNPSCSGEAYSAVSVMSGCDRRAYSSPGSSYTVASLLKLPPMEGPAFQVTLYDDKNCSSFTGQEVYLCGARYAVDGTYSVREHCLEDRIVDTFFRDSLNCSGLVTDPPNGWKGFHNLTNGSCREGVKLEWIS